MITYKTEEELKLIARGGQILHKTFNETLSAIKSGVTTAYIDNLAESLIRAEGAEPGFQRVADYQWTTCICINNQVVHTPPSSRIIRYGDIVTLDMGVFYKGFNTDKATTIPVGSVSQEVVTFLSEGKKALQNAIKQAKAGKRIGNISQSIGKDIQKAGYWVIRNLTGHGVGKALHEDPFIPGYLQGKAMRTPEIKPGMALAIEVIYAQSRTDITEEDGLEWSLVTENGSLSAMFEETVGVFNNKTLILT